MEVRSLDEGAPYSVSFEPEGNRQVLGRIASMPGVQVQLDPQWGDMMERKESIGCGAAYGVGQEVLRLDPFGIGSFDQNEMPEEPMPDIDPVEDVVEAGD